MGVELVDCHSMHSPLDVEGVLHTDPCAIPKHAMVHTRHNSSMLKQLLQTNFQHLQGEIANWLSSNGARSRYFTHSHMHMGHDGCMALQPQMEQPDTSTPHGPSYPLLLQAMPLPCLCGPQPFALFSQEL